MKEKIYPNMKNKKKINWNKEVTKWKRKKEKWKQIVIQIKKIERKSNSNKKERK